MKYHLNDNEDNISYFIMRLRTAENLTQQELADLWGVNKATILRWENGHCSPTLSEFIRCLAISGYGVYIE